MMPVPIAPVMMPIFSFHWFFVSKKYRVRALSGCQPERQCSQTVVAQSCPVWTAMPLIQSDEWGLPGCWNFSLVHFSG